VSYQLWTSHCQGKVPIYVIFAATGIKTQPQEGDGTVRMGGGNGFERLKREKKNLYEEARQQWTLEAEWLLLMQLLAPEGGYITSERPVAFGLVRKRRSLKLLYCSSEKRARKGSKLNSPGNIRKGCTPLDPQPHSQNRNLSRRGRVTFGEVKENQTIKTPIPRQNQKKPKEIFI